jgi:hypothetical protein
MLEQKWELVAVAKQAPRFGFFFRHIAWRQTRSGHAVIMLVYGVV